MPDIVPVLVLVLGAASVGTLVFWWQRERRRRIAEALTRFLAANPGWQGTTQLCGRSAEELADRTVATPRGDRRYGLAHVVSGPLSVGIAGYEAPCRASCGRWWYEERHTSTDAKGHTRTRYEREEIPIAAVILPATLPAAIRLAPESLFGRFGLTRGGEQLESDAFNRRFRVEGEDRTLTVQLLDAHLQQHLLDGFTERRIEFRGELLVLGGDPREPDPDLFGPIGDLPGLQRDARDLLAAVPAQFWRAIGADDAHGRPPPSPTP